MDLAKRDVTISSVGRINGRSFRATGDGQGDVTTGDWDFSVTFADIPEDVSPFVTLIGILILPTVVFGREVGEARNLTTLVGGNLEFTQLTRGDEIAVQSFGSIREDDNGLLWTSEAEGEIGTFDVSEVEPFDAIMLPMGNGKIADVLTFPFMTGQGRRLVHAVRNITFTPRAELAGIQFRRIEIQPSASEATVRVGTRSTIRCC